MKGGARLSRLAEITKTSVFPDLDEGPGWSIYLDDTRILEKVATKAEADLEGKAPDSMLLEYLPTFTPTLTQCR